MHGASPQSGRAKAREKLCSLLVVVTKRRSSIHDVHAKEQERLVKKQKSVAERHQFGKSHIRKFQVGKKSETSTAARAAAALRWKMHVGRRRDNTYFDTLPTSNPRKEATKGCTRTDHPSIAVNAAAAKL